MRREATLLTLLFLPLSQCERANAFSAAPQSCDAFGWRIMTVINADTENEDLGLAVVYRLDANGKPKLERVKPNMKLCPGDVLETWINAETTVVQGNNQRHLIGSSGAILMFADDVYQYNGVVTYLYLSDLPGAVIAMLGGVQAKITDIRSTLQVSMEGPRCDPTFEVSVSPYDDPFDKGDVDPNPEGHGVTLTLVDMNGKVRSRATLKGDQWARVTPGSNKPIVGDLHAPEAEEVKKRLRAQETVLRQRLSNEPAPSLSDAEKYAPIPIYLHVKANTEPAEVWVNGFLRETNGWFPMGGRRDGEKYWEIASKLVLPPGRSVVKVVLKDGRVVVQEVNPERANKAFIIEFQDDSTPPLSPPLPPPVDPEQPACTITSVGGPSGENERLPVKGTSFTFIGLTEGRFCMGSPIEFGVKGDEFPRHPVEVSAFMLMQSEVTQAQWREVVLAGQAAGDAEALALSPAPAAHKGDSFPVEQVSWCDAARFANVLSRLDGRPAAYQITEGCAVFHTGSERGFRLPTEAEWEYAARAGMTTTYATGNDVDSLKRAGWYEENTRSTREVCTASAKPWNLCDLYGNVSEWTWDWYAPQYSAAFAVNPSGPMEGTKRVVRGGSFQEGPLLVRAASRDQQDPELTVHDIGFRLAAPSPSSP